MVPSALRFVPYEESADVANIVVDGSPNAGTVLVVPHWLGLPTPPGCATDTSALAVVTLAEADRSSGHRFAGRIFRGIHPIALHGATERTTILIIDQHEGRHHLTCRYEGWVQFRSRRIRPRVDLRPLADQLSAAEPGGARWTATPPNDLTPEMYTVAEGTPSSLDPPDLIEAVTNYIRNAAPGWDPYAVH